MTDTPLLTTANVVYRDGKFWLEDRLLATVRHDPPRGKDKSRLWRASVGDGVELLADDVEGLARKVADWHAGSHRQAATGLPRVLLGSGPWPRLGFVRTAGSWEPFVARIVGNNMIETHEVLGGKKRSGVAWQDLERELVAYSGQSCIPHEVVQAEWRAAQASQLPLGYERIRSSDVEDGREDVCHLYRREGEGAWTGPFTLEQCNAAAWAHLAATGGLGQLARLLQAPESQPSADAWWQSPELRLDIAPSSLGPLMRAVAALFDLVLVQGLQLTRHPGHVEVRLKRSDALCVMGLLEQAGEPFRLVTPQGRVAFPASADAQRAPGTTAPE